MSIINLIDFFTYFDGNPNQREAVSILGSQMPESLMRDSSDWVVKYREKPPAPPAPEWPISKEQMGRIMGCSPSSLPDSLMDDFALCVKNLAMTKVEQAYFLGQCGHESCGLRYPMEIHSGSDYEGRSDLGNTVPGYGVKYAGTGWIQVTGAYWHEKFSKDIGDPLVFELGKTYTCDKYPWSISAFWWKENKMQSMCNARPQFTNYQIDEVGARVNGRMRPNGADDRLVYTRRAITELGL